MSVQYAHQKKVLALSGGVGGAKLALGLSEVLGAGQLSVLCNTADDFVHMGLPISPDIDTVMYTLAGENNKGQGWGLANESWRVMDRVAALGGENWFRLGDLDLATHLCRAQWLAQGQSLSEVTDRLAQQLGIKAQLLPMTDQRVSTRVITAAGDMGFQDYFVREQCQPVVQSFSFDGIEQCKPANKLIKLLHDDDLAAIIICPSNPFVSIDPILAVPGIKQALGNASAAVLAISPIVGGEALKGPAAKMLGELGLEVSPVAVAKHYGRLLDGIIIDSVDDDKNEEIAELGVAVHCTNTVMHTLDEKKQLAIEALNFSRQLMPVTPC
jgi:LPPG:FO 2-phospho-L-lactate transferase